MADPYTLPNGTLRNKLEITDSDKLSVAEANRTYHRLQRIETEGPKGPFSFERLKETHRYIFQDVYEWAGKVRETELYKDGHKFGQRALIERRGRELTNALARSNELRGLSRESFAERAADLMGAINQLHPFREGNGRTQREFMFALSRQAGHELNFDVVSRERMIQASIESSGGRPEMMRRLFSEISDPRRVAQLETAIRSFEKAKYNWNDRYLATTTPGQKYQGTFAGRAGPDFMMRTDREIFIGNAADIPANAQHNDKISFTAGGEQRTAARQQEAAQQPADKPMAQDKAAQYAELEARIRRIDQAEGRRRQLDKGRDRDDGSIER